MDRTRQNDANDIFSSRYFINKSFKPIKSLDSGIFAVFMGRIFSEGTLAGAPEFDVNDPVWRSKIQAGLIEMMQYHSKLCLENHLGIKPHEKALPINHHEIPVYGFWLTLVLLSTENMHIILKTHFNFSTLRPILVKIFSNQEIDITMDMAESFMNEFSNLYGTKIRNELTSIGIPTGMSLPLLTRGFDNFFFEENFRVLKRQSENAINSDHYHLSGAWQFMTGVANIAFTVEIDIMSSKTYASLGKLVGWEPDAGDTDNKGQLEFL